MHESLAFFMDRGMGSRVVPMGLRSAGWIVTTMDDRYGTEASQRIADVDWIRDASRRGELLICKDRRLAKRPLEAAAIATNHSRVVVITDSQITGAEMVTRLLENAERIERRALRTAGPWVLGVSSDGVRSLRLNG